MTSNRWNANICNQQTADSDWMLLINLISHFCSWAKLVLGCFDLTPHWGYRLNPVMQPIPLQPKAASQQVAKKAGMPKCKAFKGRRSMYKTLQSHFPMDCQPRCWIVCTSTGFGWHCSSLCLDWATLKDLKDSFSPHPCTVMRSTIKCSF